MPSARVDGTTTGRRRRARTPSLAPCRYSKTPSPELARVLRGTHRRPASPGSSRNSTHSASSRRRSNSSCPAGRRSSSTSSSSSSSSTDTSRTRRGSLLTLSLSSSMVSRRRSRMASFPRISSSSTVLSRPIREGTIRHISEAASHHTGSTAVYNMAAARQPLWRTTAHRFLSASAQQPLEATPHDLALVDTRRPRPSSRCPLVPLRRRVNVLPARPSLRHRVRH